MAVSNRHMQEKLRVKAERKERTQFLKKFRGRKQRNMIKKLRIQLDKARTILALCVKQSLLSCPYANYCF